MRSKKFLITGGNGYIGENLQLYLMKRRYNYEVCDYETSAPDLPLAQDLDDLSMYDGVVHLAALSGIQACEDEPDEAWIKNVVTAANIFVKALKAKIPVVFTSSQCAKDPKSGQYALMKWLVEQMAFLYNNERHDIKRSHVYILRLTNVYGGIKYLEKKNTVVKRFIDARRNNDPIMIDGDGMQVRDFIHVEDVCLAILNCLNCFPEIHNKYPMDIGTGIGTSINELAYMLPHGPISKETARSVGAESSIADLTDAKIMMDFNPLLNRSNRLEEYIREMCNEKTS